LGTVASKALVAVFATVFALGILPKAWADDRRGCSDASLQGSFGFTSAGTLLALPPPLAGPFTEIGRQIFDGRGNTEATATLSANGNIVSGEIIYLAPVENISSTKSAPVPVRGTGLKMTAILG
jgi:hypothetical protein